MIILLLSICVIVLVILYLIYIYLYKNKYPIKITERFEASEECLSNYRTLSEKHNQVITDNMDLVQKVASLKKENDELNEKLQVCNKINDTHRSNLNRASESVQVTSETTATCQANLDECQNKINKTLENVTKQYEDIAQEYNKLLISYNELANQYYVKCYNYNLHGGCPEKCKECPSDVVVVEEETWF